MLKEVRLGLIGFGNVGQGLAQILQESRDEIRSNRNLDIKITAICDTLKGNVADPAGLDASRLLQVISQNGSFKGLPEEKPEWDATGMIRKSATDVIVELSYTDLRTGQPAINHFKEALRQRKHVISTNKGPIALVYPELQQLAEENGVSIGLEGTVMSGTPAIRLGREMLAPAHIRKVMGIFNGTTNYILTRMESGLSYAEALAEAQKLGYAEADPSGDVEGFDAAGKVVILANLLLEAWIGMEQVERQGITEITSADIQSAREAGERWKLIGCLEKVGDGICASVQPQRLPVAHPLAGVSGATNAIQYYTDYLGEITLIGPGAGRLATGYAVLEDLLAIYR